MDAVPYYQLEFLSGRTKTCLDLIFLWLFSPYLFLNRQNLQNATTSVHSNMNTGDLCIGIRTFGNAILSSMMKSTTLLWTASLASKTLAKPSRGIVLEKKHISASRSC